MRANPLPVKKTPACFLDKSNHERNTSSQSGIEDMQSTETDADGSALELDKKDISDPGCGEVNGGDTECSSKVERGSDAGIRGINDEDR